MRESDGDPTHSYSSDKVSSESGNKREAKKRKSQREEGREVRARWGARRFVTREAESALLRCSPRKSPRGKTYKEREYSGSQERTGMLQERQRKIRVSKDGTKTSEQDER